MEIVRVSADEHTAYQFGNILDADGNPDFDMIIAGWESDYPDIAGNIEPLYSSANTGEGGSNTAVYVNDQVDELIAYSPRQQTRISAANIYSRLWILSLRTSLTFSWNIQTAR